jgi:hypothetical protein
MRSSSSITDRIMGILTFKAPTYREVAEDPKATGEAATIVIVMAILSAILSWAITSARGVSAGSPIGSAVGSLLGTLIGWLVGAWLLAWVSKTFFQGRTNTSEMLRVTGYIAVFDIVQVIPIIGPFIAGILHLIGYIIGIREAAEVTTSQAIGIAIIVVVILLAIALVLAICALPFIFAGAVLSSP